MTNLKNLYLLFLNTYTVLHLSRDHLVIRWSRDKCKTVYLHFCNIYGHQTWQSSNLRWADPIFKFTWIFDYVATWQMKKTYIYTSTMPIATKLGRVVAYIGGTSSNTSRNLLISCSREKWKNLILAFPPYLEPLNLAEY